jgi:hypothetical protein
MRMLLVCTWALPARAEDSYIDTAYDAQDDAGPEGRVIAGEDSGWGMNPLKDPGERQQYSIDGEQGTDVQPDFDRSFFDGEPPLTEQPLHERVGSAVRHDRTSVDEASEFCLRPGFGDETNGDGDDDAYEPRPKHTV